MNEIKVKVHNKREMQLVNIIEFEIESLRKVPRDLDYFYDRVGSLISSLYFLGCIDEPCPISRFNIDDVTFTII